MKNNKIKLIAGKEITNIMLYIWLNIMCLLIINYWVKQLNEMRSGGIDFYLSIRDVWI